MKELVSWDNPQRMQNAPGLSVGWIRVHGVTVFLAALAAVLLLLLVSPKICTAASSQLVWGNFTEDYYTGEIISDDRVYIEDGGTYPVALHSSKDVYVTHDG